MNKTNELATESIGKLLLKFSIPAIIGLLVNVFYNIVDRIFVSRGIDSLALSGVAITFPITNVIMAFSMLAGVGAAAVVSIKLGQNKKEEAEKVLGNAFVLLVIFSLFLTTIGLIFLNPILKILGASPEILPYARQFAFVIILGIILQSVSMGLNNLIRSSGNPGIAMVTMLIGAGINFVANPIFIFGLKLGVTGSALATTVSQSVTTVWTLSYFLKGKGLLKLKKENMKLDMSIIKQILAIGASPFLMQLAASLVTISFNSGLKTYGGDIAIGAMALVNSVVMLVLMPVIGINQGVQPIIGYNYGAKDFVRVKKALKTAMIVATCITSVGFIFVQLFPVQIIRVFNTSDTTLISMGSRGLSRFMLMLPIAGIAIVGSNFFQAIARAKLSMLLSLLRQVIVLLPLIRILPHFFGLDGIWMTQPIADVISVAITAVILIRELKKMSAPKEEAVPNPVEAM